MIVTPPTPASPGHLILLADANDVWGVGLVMGIMIAILYWRMSKERRRSARLLAELELTTRRRQLVLNFLHDLAEGFAVEYKLNQLLHKIVQFSVNTTQASAGAIFLFDAERSSLRAEIVVGPFPPPVRPPDFNEDKYAGKPDQLERVAKLETIFVKEGLIGEVAQSGKAVLIRNGKIDQRLPRYKNPALQIRTAIYMPMKFSEEVLGVMVVVNKVVGDAPQSFNSSDVFLLDSLASHGAISLHNFTLHQLQEEQLLVEADMRVASEIQRMLLPDQAPEVENFDLFALNHAAQHVSGDYYDFIKLNDSRVGVVIADVSGKAVSGALVMATCRSILRTQCVSSSSPASVLRQVNNVLLGDLPEDMFVTLIYGVLDGPNRTFTFARAGHDPAIWYQAANQTVEILSPKGVALGLSRKDHFERALEERQIILAPGDILLLYTDGITESLDKSQNEFGRDRLIQAVRECASQTPREIAEAIIHRLDEFTGATPPHDDRTLLLIKSL